MQVAVSAEQNYAYYFNDYYQFYFYEQMSL